MNNINISIIICLLIVTRGYSQNNIIPPEERGEFFLEVKSEDLLKMLSEYSFESAYSGEKHWENPKCIELRKIAIQLGERQMKGTFKPMFSEQKIIDKAIDKYLELAKSGRAYDFMEAEAQVYRFWHLAKPALLKNIDNNKDTHKRQLATNWLLKMKDEHLIKILIERSKKVKAKNEKLRYQTLLSFTNNYYRVPVKNRQGMTKEEAENLYTRLVAPELPRLQEEIRQFQEKQ